MADSLILVITVLHTDPLEHSPSRLMSILIDCAFSWNEFVLDKVERRLLGETGEGVAGVALLLSALSDSKIFTPFTAASSTTPVFHLLLMHLNIGLIDHHLGGTSLFATTIILWPTVLLLTRCCVRQTPSAALAHFPTIHPVELAWGQRVFLFVQDDTW